mgnify:CR=1 FL=1
MAIVTMKQLLETGVHFGHRTRRWDPRMARYIYTERNGVHIIDLQQTVRALEIAYGVTRDIVAQGHSLGNHSFRHDLLGAFRSARTMTHDIRATQRALKTLGIVALAYRPPMGITSPRLRGVMQAEGMFVVNFSCRAWDGGNRRIRNLSRRILSRVRAGDILLLHENLPQPSLLPVWAGEVDRILAGIREKGLEVLPLADLIGRPVMAAAAEPDGRRCAGSGGPAALTGPDAYVPRSAHPDEH